MKDPISGDRPVSEYLSMAPYAYKYGAPVQETHPRDRPLSGVGLVKPTPSQLAAMSENPQYTPDQRELFKRLSDALYRPGVSAVTRARDVTALGFTQDQARAWCALRELALAAKLDEGIPAELHTLIQDRSTTPETKQERAIAMGYDLEQVLAESETRMAARIEEMRVRRESVHRQLLAGGPASAAITRLLHWFDAGDYRLRKNDVSRYHKFVEAGQQGKTLAIGNSYTTTITYEERQIIVVEHDWLSAFKDALRHEELSDFVLPFPLTVFELNLGGTIAIVHARMGEDHALKLDYAFDCGDGFWASPPGDVKPTGVVYDTIYAHIKAICIALDSEVAVHEHRSAPSALNVKRAKIGKPPLEEFRIVRLHPKHRGRTTPSPSRFGTSQYPKRHVRMHFRRGHWVHFNSERYSDGVRGTKKWINWMLVGDPDLGFIEHQYRI